VKAKMDLDVEAEFNRNNEDDRQNVTVEAEIDENFEFDDIEDNETGRYRPNITVKLEY
jgi:hypothetical protein